MSLSIVCILVLMGVVIGYLIRLSSEKPSEKKDQNKRSIAISDVDYHNHARVRMAHQSISQIVIDRFINRLKEWYPEEDVDFMIEVKTGSPIALVVKVGNRIAELESTEMLEQFTFGQNEKQELEQILINRTQ